VKLLGFLGWVGGEISGASFQLGSPEVILPSLSSICINDIL
jgi:hypothetical protein